MKIGIVNDSPMAAELLRRLIRRSEAHQIAWIARDGEEAVKLCERDLPELVLMDLIMPYMDGAEATRRIMSRTPCPILIVTATVGGNAAKVFEALGAGAIDAIDTPTVTGFRRRWSGIAAEDPGHRASDLLEGAFGERHSVKS